MSKAASGEPGFWDHVDALRGVLLRIGGVIVVLATVLFWFMREIFDSVILAPCRADFPLYRLLDNLEGLGAFAPQSAGTDFHVELINIQLASQFFIHLSTSCWLAAILAFPFIIYQLWTFVEPALYPSEKRNVRMAFLWGNIMFFIGVAVGYFLVFPLTLRFLADYQLSADIPNTITIDSYMDNFLLLTLLMGTVFELPMLAWTLGKMGLLTRSFFNRYRRHAIVALLIIAAMITPTGDPFTLFVVFLPIYLLWEGSASIVPATPVPEE